MAGRSAPRKRTARSAPESAAEPGASHAPEPEHAPEAALALAPRSPGWPAELDTIDAPPERLWTRGRVELCAPQRVRVALVGTRAPSPYGESMARRFASALAARGVVVVSGLARGIDQAAHAGALAVGGDTIAVLGSGVDRPWPTGPLAERIAREGLLLSELRPGTPPRRHHFPLRNRLISGLSRAVLVVEAASASGSLITARWAADQGRTVWALPGRVDHPMAAGCHRLLREGASLAEHPDELLSDLGLCAGASFELDPGSAPPTRREQEGSAVGRTSPLERRLLEALRGETWTADEVARQTGSELPVVLTALVTLELAGRVVRGPGGLYRLASPR
jgi:DNA processing protein